MDVVETPSLPYAAAMRDRQSKPESPNSGLLPAIRCCAVGHAAPDSKPPSVASWPSLGMGLVPFRTPGKKDKPLRYARYGIWQRRKSPVRRCFKSRPPFGGVRRFASGCRFLPAVDRPLVRIPAARHTTTGTCDLGNPENREIRRYYKCFFRVLQRARMRPRVRASEAPPPQSGSANSEHLLRNGRREKGGNRRRKIAASPARNQSASTGLSDG
jgi:hypothetical protein